jgi:nicotinamide riboside kinase
MQEKTMLKFQTKIAKLEEERDNFKSLSETYKSRYLEAIDEVDKYKNMWNTAKLFITELLKINPNLS